MGFIAIQNNCALRAFVAYKLTILHEKHITVTNNLYFSFVQYRTTQNLSVRHRNIEKFFTQSQKSPTKGLFVFCVCL